MMNREAYIRKNAGRTVAIMLKYTFQGLLSLKIRRFAGGGLSATGYLTLNLLLRESIRIRSPFISIKVSLRSPITQTPVASGAVPHHCDTIGMG